MVCMLTYTNTFIHTLTEANTHIIPFTTHINIICRFAHKQLSISLKHCSLIYTHRSLSRFTCCLCLSPSGERSALTRRPTDLSQKGGGDDGRQPLLSQLNKKKHLCVKITCDFKSLTRLSYYTTGNLFFFLSCFDWKTSELRMSKVVKCRTDQASVR